MTTQKKNLIDVMESFDVAMLVTGLADEPNGRPMRVAGHEHGDLWFITAKDSPKATEVTEDAQAMVTLQSNTAYALVRGKASLVDDTEKLREMWSTGADLYFPDGPDSDTAVLLRFSPTEGQYWDMRGTKGMKMAKNAAEAWWKGESIAHVDGSSGVAQL
ncbi:MAG: general stress protein [Deltaproteobacteria bacterium]|nr:MAG: general stress protein [Deltaproteobacteria bacterium]